MPLRRIRPSAALISSSSAHLPWTSSAAAVVPVRVVCKRYRFLYRCILAAAVTRRPAVLTPSGPPSGQQGAHISDLPSDASEEGRESVCADRTAACTAAAAVTTCPSHQTHNLHRKRTALGESASRTDASSAKPPPQRLSPEARSRARSAVSECISTRPQVSSSLLAERSAGAQ